MANFEITRISQIEPVACPCGQTRRAFVDDPDQIASLHVVEVSTEAQTHYHKRLTEIYYVLEGDCQIELDGQLHPVSTGDAVLIKPGCRHRMVVPQDAQVRMINVPVPAFDPEDEWFD